MATRFRWIIALIVAIPVCYSLFAAIYSAATWERRHMMNSASRFSIYADEFSTPRSLKDAKHAAEMMEYVQGHYVPQDGYRSDPETEKFLAEQRERAVNAFADGLKQYTGKDFGADADAWLKWIERQP